MSKSSIVVLLPTMRKNILLVVVFVAALAQAQVTLSKTQLDFGDVLTTEDKELAVNVTNTSGASLEIKAVKVYNSDFTYSTPNTTIATGATEKVRVTFAPRHNVVYNSELIFVLDDGSEYRIDLIGNGKYEGTYYASTYNKSYQDLKDALKTRLASGYVNLGYTGARDQMYANIDNVNGKVRCVYTDREATFNTRSGANSNSFNCEHTWPQSLFSSREPERADIHHLFPTDVSANSRRANYPFGVVSSASWTEGGSKLGGNTFEPRDAQKGATARAMMYFVIRYQDYSNFIDGQEAILKQWHTTYPPSAFEIQRNEKIFTYQKNRNPFVDHPEFLERINLIGGTDSKPIIKSAELMQEELVYSYVTSTETRNVYIINTGNQDLTNISAVSSANGNVVVNSIQSSAAEGEVSLVEIGFKNLPDGTYNDVLTINLQNQVGQTIEVPVTFTIGQASSKDILITTIKTHYNPNTQHISFVDAPKGIQYIEIWNTAGQQVILNDISTSLTDIPFAGQKPGVYFVVIKTEEKVYTNKILVF